jgi:hypothetical protein
MANLISTCSQKRQKSAQPEEEALTPSARRELAASALLVALDEYIRVAVERRPVGEEWVDQHQSPLGKRAHLEAVRRGSLRGVKHGRRILVRRADLNSFLENHSVKHGTATDDSRRGIDSDRASEVAAALLTRVGLRQRKG